MKKLIIPLFLCVLLCSCSVSTKTPVINNSFSKQAVIKAGEFSYDARISCENNTVYINVCSSNATGMTMSCSSNELVYSYKDMTKSIMKSDAGYYNPSVVIYDTLNSLSSSRIEKNENNYLYFGKIQAGDYVLKTDEKGNILSLVVENAQILIDFE